MDCRNLFLPLIHIWSDICLCLDGKIILFVFVYGSSNVVRRPFLQPRDIENCTSMCKSSVRFKTSNGVFPPLFRSGHFWFGAFVVDFVQMFNSGPFPGLCGTQSLLFHLFSRLWDEAGNASGHSDCGRVRSLPGRVPLAGQSEGERRALLRGNHPDSKVAGLCSSLLQRVSHRATPFFSCPTLLLQVHWSE